MEFSDIVTVDLDIVTKLQSGDNFSFSRFGDGEWNCIRGKQGRNCDAHIYYPDMGERLKNILYKSPKYYIGLQTLAFRQAPQYINEVTSEANLSWCKSDMIHHASINNNKEHRYNGYFSEFIDSLEGKKVLMVAPKRLRQFKVYDDFIEIPDVNCWLEYQNIRAKIIDKYEEDLVILYCASMMTNVIVDDIFTLYGNDLTQIDCGSAFEPYINHANRTYHANKIKELNNE